MKPLQSQPLTMEFDELRRPLSTFQREVLGQAFALMRENPGGLTKDELCRRIAVDGRHPSKVTVQRAFDNARDELDAPLVVEKGRWRLTCRDYGIPADAPQHEDLLALALLSPIAAALGARVQAVILRLLEQLEDRARIPRSGDALEVRSLARCPFEFDKMSLRIRDLKTVALAMGRDALHVRTTTPELFIVRAETWTCTEHGLGIRGREWHDGRPLTLALTHIEGIRKATAYLGPCAKGQQQSAVEHRRGHVSQRVAWSFIEDRGMSSMKTVGKSFARCVSPLKTRNS